MRALFKKKREGEEKKTSFITFLFPVRFTPPVLKIQQQVGRLGQLKDVWIPKKFLLRPHYERGALHRENNQMFSHISSGKNANNRT